MNEENKEKEGIGVFDEKDKAFPKKTFETPFIDIIPIPTLPVEEISIDFPEVKKSNRRTRKDK